MGELPTGTVTFLFTDIEGSTRLLQQLGEAYEAVEVQHASILREAIAEGGGTEIRTEGDSFFAAFPRPTGAVHAVVAAQRALHTTGWPGEMPLRVRMGIHTGEGRIGGSGSAADYIGIDVNRAARIAAAAHGGQVLVSDATRALVEHGLPDGVTLRDLGEHRLKDIEHPERLFDLVIDGLPADFPPIRTLEVPSNLPQERTSFIGRDREVEDVTGLLTETRLVTLTGPGGTGKTRLALKVAAEQVGGFAGGVFLVDLSAIVDPALVTSAIAAALRVRERPGRDLLDSLADHLRDRETLLLLDNFEQVADAAPSVGRLLDAVPGLTVLATSRVPLHLSGEQEYEVSPLALPDRGGDLETLRRCEAVMLFAERALAVRPSFRLSDENAGTVAEITARLDGLPLAIELAASRLKLLDPGTMLGRLEQRLPLLTGGARDLPERQRALRSAIEWSHDLLKPEERRLFARLSVFAGGWTLEAAETVGGPGLGLEVLEGLGSLVDGSLAQRRATPDDGVWFQMLETIREYAAERLAESGEEGALRRRHAEYVRDLVEEAEPHLTGEDQTRWLARLEREHDNVRAALEWATDAGEAETALRTGAAVWRFWQQGGHLAEGRSRLERLFTLPGAEAPDAVRVRTLGALGSIAYWQGDYGATRAAYEEALEISRDIGDSGLVARALFDLSFMAMVERDFDRQENLLRESLAESKDADPGLTARIWASLGYLDMFRGNNARAIERIEQAIAINRQMGDRILLAQNLTGVFAVRFVSGDIEGSRHDVREAVRIQAEARSPLTFAFALLALSALANQEGRHRQAARLTGARARLLEDVGGGPPAVALTAFPDAETDARRALGPDEYERARAEGYSMTIEEAVAFALEESE